MGSSLASAATPSPVAFGSLGTDFLIEPPQPLRHRAQRHRAKRARARRGDGAVTVDDVQPIDATFLGEIALNFEESGDFVLDFSEFLAGFAPGEVLGL